MNTALVNLTPHAIAIIGDGGVFNLPPSGQVARVATARTATATLTTPCGVAVAVTAATRGEITDLPAPQVGVIFVVSAMVADAVRRADVMSPGDLVRGPDGQPIGCLGLTAWAPTAGGAL